MQIPRHHPQILDALDREGPGTDILSEPHPGQPQEILTLGIHSEKPCPRGQPPAGLLLPE